MQSNAIFGCIPQPLWGMYLSLGGQRPHLMTWKKINPILFQFWDTWRLQECDEINLFARIERMSIFCIQQHFTHFRSFWGSFWVIKAPFSQQIVVFMTILCLNVYLLLKSFKRRCHMPMSDNNHKFTCNGRGWGKYRL